MNKSVCPRRHPNAAYKIVDGEALIVMPGSEAVHHVLNAVGSSIWDLLDGGHDLEEIATRIAQEFSVEPQAARQDMQDFLSDLEQQGLLKLDGGPLASSS